MSEEQRVMSDLDKARSALRRIESLHPTGRIVVGAQTHGGPLQYADGCQLHGGWCRDWSASRVALESLRAYLGTSSTDSTGN